MQTEMPLHQLAELFPEMTDAEQSSLRESIASIGCTNPVKVWRGQLVDGRHRWSACQDLLVDCPIEDVSHWDEAQLLDYVLAENDVRRHLTPSQRAALAVHVGKLREAMESDEPGKARDKVAEQFGVSPRLIQQAAQVQKANPHKLKEIMKGDGNITKAVKELKPRPGFDPDETPEIPEINESDEPVIHPALEPHILDRFDALVKHLHQANRMAREIRGAVGSDYFTLADFELSIKNGISEVKFSKPHCVCPYCRGHGCKTCRRSGYLNEDVSEKVPQEVWDALDAEPEEVSAEPRS